MHITLQISVFRNSWSYLMEVWSLVPGNLAKCREIILWHQWLFLFQPVEELSPKDENGKLIFYPVDLSHTWEVSPGRWEWREKSAEGEPPSFLPPVRMGCGPSDSAVHESKGMNAGVVERKSLLKCSQRGMEEENLGSADRYLFPSMWYIFSGVFLRWGNHDLLPEFSSW